jgi:hypothetical protein
VKPKVEFELTFNDKRFLKSLRIDPEGPSDPDIARPDIARPDVAKDDPA